MTLGFEEEPGDSHGVASNCGWMLKIRPITFDFACLTQMEPTRIRLGLGSFFLLFHHLFQSLIIV